jgi:copper chaperone CopZ
MEHQYTITGMTCEGCKAKVRRTLEAFSEVTEADINLADGKTTIKMNSHVNTAEFQSALAEKGKYTITEVHKKPENVMATEEEPKGFFATYKPLMLIVAFIAGISFLVQTPLTSFSGMLWMRHFMAGFFIVFSFFKLLNLQGFADSYRMYDIVAEKWKAWGLIYPFVELALGLAYLTNWNPNITNWTTVIVLGVSTIGVIKSNLNKRKIKCACLGDVFNLPMSNVTIVEDVTMVAMAIFMLI